MTFTVREITDRLYAALPGELIAFEHTGGGVHTLFVGPVHEGSGAWAVAVGPFERDGTVEDDGIVFVGFDVNTELPRPYETATAATAGDAVEAVVAFQQHICRSCGGHTEAPQRQEHQFWPLRHVVCPVCALAAPRPEVTPLALATLAGTILAHDVRQIRGALVALPDAVGSDVGVNIVMDLDVAPGGALVRGSLEVLGEAPPLPLHRQWSWVLDQEGTSATCIDIGPAGVMHRVARALLTEQDTVTFIDAT